MQASNRPLQRFRFAAGCVVPAVAARDAQDCIFHVAVVLLFHRLGGLALTFALATVFAEDVAGEDLDFGHEVSGVGGVLEHGVDEVFFVAERFVGSISFCVATKGEDKWW